MNESVLGFDTTTAEFKTTHHISMQYMDKEHVVAWIFMGAVLKRKISEAAPVSDAELRGCIDTSSATMKRMFAELGVHKNERRKIDYYCRICHASSHFVTLRHTSSSACWPARGFHPQTPTPAAGCLERYARSSLRTLTAARRSLVWSRGRTSSSDRLSFPQRDERDPFA